jgi:SAM-dependent methyltransferase
MRVGIARSWVSFRDPRVDRPRFLARTYAALLGGRVLDVGCDRCALRDLLRAREYVGLDRTPEADVRQDLAREPRLPFPDRSFDAVVCADVLEHLEGLHALFGELVRVTRTDLLVTLPNCWNGAIAHYGLPLEPPPDRHRWFFSLAEAEAFLRGQARRHALELAELRALEKDRPWLVRLARRIRHPRPERYLNLYAHTLIAHLRRR